MPRHSRAAIETASLCVDVRRTMPPKPPPELTDGQAAIWRDVVGSLPGDWIARGGYPILIQYCRHVARSRLIEEQIRALSWKGHWPRVVWSAGICFCRWRSVRRNSSLTARACCGSGPISRSVRARQAASLPRSPNLNRRGVAPTCDCHGEGARRFFRIATSDSGHWHGHRSRNRGSAGQARRPRAAGTAPTTGDDDPAVGLGHSVLSARIMTEVIDAHEDKPRPGADPLWPLAGFVSLRPAQYPPAGRGCFPGWSELVSK